MNEILSRLKCFERMAARKLGEAFQEARSRESISIGDRRLVEKVKASDLNAANPFARILLGKHLWSEFESYFELSNLRATPEEPLYWVTLADVDCITDVDQRNVDIAGMIRKLRTWACGTVVCRHHGSGSLRQHPARHSVLQP